MTKTSLRIAVFAVMCQVLAHIAPAQTPLGTGFTYQGQVKQSGQAINGTVDFEFSLWDTAGSGSPPTGGTQIGVTQAVDSVSVVGGLFTVQLNSGGEFIATVFDGDARWLQIAVRSPAGSGEFTTLTPRQPLTAAPFALFALNGPGAGGAFWAAKGADIHNTNTGRVGIGTTNPIGKLDVNGSVRAGDLITRSPWADVRAYGVAGDDCVDDTAAIQSAIDATVSAGGGSVYFAPGEYRTCAPLVIDGQHLRLVGAGRGASRIVNAQSDLIHLGLAVNPNNFECRHLSLIAQGGGHVFKVGAAIGAMCLESLSIIQNSPNWCIWDQNGTEYIDNLVLNCFLEHHPDATVPAWRFVGGVVNSNTWMRCRATWSGEYFFHIENTAADAWFYDNVFRDITWEVTNGGCIQALGVNNLIVENCNVYDLHVHPAKKTLRDLYLFGPSRGGLASRDCAIRNCHRRGGKLGTDLNDIRVKAPAQGFTIENCRHAGGDTPFTMDLESAHVLLIGIAPEGLVLNGGNATQLQRGRLLVDGPPFIGSGAGDPNGSVTAPIGSIFLRRDGGSGSSLYVKESGNGNTGWVPK